MADRHVRGARLSAFLDDELAEEAALRVSGHVADCRRCHDELEGLRATRAALRELPGLRAPVLTGGVVARNRRRRRLGRRARVAALAAALPLGLAAAAYVAGGEGGDVTPSTELFLVEHVARSSGGPVPAPVRGGGG